MHPFEISQHFVVPEAKHSIPFSFEKAGADDFGVRFRIVLAALSFNDQSG
jgi:hypothetical protein